MKNFVCFALLNLLFSGTILVTGCDAPAKGTIEGMTAQRVSEALLLLELSGLIESLPGKQYRRLSSS